MTLGDFDLDGFAAFDPEASASWVACRVLRDAHACEIRLNRIFATILDVPDFVRGCRFVCNQLASQSQLRKWDIGFYLGDVVGADPPFLYALIDTVKWLRTSCPSVNCYGLEEHTPLQREFLQNGWISRFVVDGPSPVADGDPFIESLHIPSGRDAANASSGPETILDPENP